MTKITITRIGQAKEISGVSQKTNKPYSFKKVGVQSNEYGDRWLDITFNDECPVKVGQSYEVEVTEREYNGKTYYDAKLPKENYKRFTESTETANKLTTLTLRFNKLMSVLVEKGILEMPEEPKPVIPGTSVEYPIEESELPTF